MTRSPHDFFHPLPSMVLTLVSLSHWQSLRNLRAAKHLHTLNIVFAPASHQRTRLISPTYHFGQKGNRLEVIGGKVRGG